MAQCTQGPGKRLCGGSLGAPGSGASRCSQRDRLCHLPFPLCQMFSPLDFRKEPSSFLSLTPSLAAAQVGVSAHRWRRQPCLSGTHGPLGWQRRHDLCCPGPGPVCLQSVHGRCGCPLPLGESPRPERRRCLEDKSGVPCCREGHFLGQGLSAGFSSVEAYLCKSQVCPCPAMSGIAD